MKEDKEIYALGIGRNTPVFIDLAEACGYTIAGLYHYNDDRTGEYDHGLKILGSFKDLYQKDTLAGMNFLLTMGDNQIRSDVFYKIISFMKACSRAYLIKLTDTRIQIHVTNVQSRHGCFFSVL